MPFELNSIDIPIKSKNVVTMSYDNNGRFPTR